MKLRPHYSVSERELVVRLGESGRPVSLATLAGWRKNGLLPPFASRGLGQAKGKTYYWTNADVVDQARAVFDLEQTRAALPTIMILWLLGFPVPLTRVRKAWARTSPCARHWRVGEERCRLQPANSNLSGWAQLLQLGLTLGKSIGHDRSAELATAFHLLTPTRENAQNDWLLLLTTHLGAVLEASDLFNEAADDQVEDALTRCQRLLDLAVVQLANADSEKVAGKTNPDRKIWIVNRFGPQTFLIVLFLIRQGLADLADRAIEDAAFAIAEHRRKAA